MSRLAVVELVDSIQGSCRSTDGRCQFYARKVGVPAGTCSVHDGSTPLTLHFHAHQARSNVPG